MPPQTRSHTSTSQLTRPQRRKIEVSEIPDTYHDSDHDTIELPSYPDTSRPSAVFTPEESKGREWTLSLAIPGSFILNAALPHSKMDLAGRIARAAAIFCVDEIVVFDDAPDRLSDKQKAVLKLSTNDPKGRKTELLELVPPDEDGYAHPVRYLEHVLAFCECPSHLRKYLFPMHPTLYKSGMLPTLDLPHHMKAHEWCQYREGIALDTQDVSFKWPDWESIKTTRKPSADAPHTTFVDCGFKYPVMIIYNTPISPGARITLKFAHKDSPPNWPHLSGADIFDLDVEPVDQSAPRTEAGWYWGYTTRTASCVSDVFEECPFAEGYDYSIGTSERGIPVNQILPDNLSTKLSRTAHSSSQKGVGVGVDKLPDRFKHLIVFFGGVAGLEPAVEADPKMGRARRDGRGLTKDTASAAFDAWVNLVPGQGSRTIRMEEAVLIGLMGLRGYVFSQGL